MKINKNEFALILSPIENKDKNWTGEIDIRIKYDSKNKYKKEEVDSFVNLMTLMCTSVDLMETDEGFLTMLHDHRDHLNDSSVENQLELLDSLEDKVTKSPKIVEKVGNVIKINWNTK
jgi:hypothetical protein